MLDEDLVEGRLCLRPGQGLMEPKFLLLLMMYRFFQPQHLILDLPLMRLLRLHLPLSGSGFPGPAALLGLGLLQGFLKVFLLMAQGLQLRRPVKDMEEAISFINAHSTGHSESIITKNYFKAQHFLDQVDAAAVYVNASTRFTDGGEFGLGAEIGISTQKMHARGPMGLEELTSCKYVIYGEGQVR